MCTLSVPGMCEGGNKYDLGITSLHGTVMEGPLNAVHMLNYLWLNLLASERF